MFDPSSMLPCAVLEDNIPAPACILPSFDGEETTIGSSSTSADDLNFSVTTDGSTGGGALWVKATSTDMLSIGSFNDYISYNFKVNSLSGGSSNREGLSFGVILINENVDLTNFFATVINNALSFTIAAGNPDEVTISISVVGSSNIQIVSVFNDVASFDFADMQMTISFKQDTSEFQISIITDSGNELISAFYLTEFGTVTFGTLRACIFMSNMDVAATAEVCSLSGNFSQGSLLLAKPATATACGVAPNGTAAANIIVAKTGQTVDYTPAGRTSKDDGGNQIGRINKTSVNANPVNITANTPWTGILDDGQYSGSTVIAWGSQSETIDNGILTIPQLGLMVAGSWLVANYTFAWDDSGGTDDDIFAFCDAANLASYCGHTDWRVANLFEAINFLKYDATFISSGVSVPSAAATAGGYIELPSNLWTSTTLPSNTGRAMTIKTDGEIGIRNKSAGGSSYAPILVRNTQVDAI